MLKFTIVKGKLVLDPNIVLLKDLHALYKVKDGPKYLQIIYYVNSTDMDNPFRDLDIRVMEEQVLRAVFDKSSWAELKMTSEVQAKFDKAEALFINHNTTAETRLLSAVNKKLDQISTLLDETEPEIVQETSNSGETKFNTNLTIILSLFSKIETIMKSKSLLNNAIMSSTAVGKIRGGGTSSFREKGLLKT